MLAIFASCQEKVDQPSAGEEPELTTVTLNLNASDLTGEPDSKANTPLIPDIENSYTTCGSYSSVSVASCTPEWTSSIVQAGRTEPDS